MEAFSSLLLNLYRLAQNVPPTEYQTRALDAIRDVLPFDSAVWGSGAIGPEGPIVHSVCAYRQPPEMMENWAGIKQFDVLGYEAFSRMGQTQNAPLTDPDWQARVHPDVMAHINRFGMVHTLTTLSAVPVLHLVSTISFYRADPECPFSEAERQLKQNLVPHLVETWNTNRLAFTHSSGSREIQLHRARAIFDKLGVLHNASQNFDVLMHAEWPDWQGPLLPPVLPDTLSGEGTHQYTGKNIVATSRALNDLFLLSIRKKSVVDDLSPRELGVAKLSGQGKDFREIAEELHLAPATVRNHLQAIYIKLGVNNKVEMARLILEAEGLRIGNL